MDNTLTAANSIPLQLRFTPLAIKAIDDNWCRLPMRQFPLIKQQGTGNQPVSRSFHPCITPFFGGTLGFRDPSRPLNGSHLSSSLGPLSVALLVSMSQYRYFYTSSDSVLPNEYQQYLHVFDKFMLVPFLLIIHTIVLQTCSLVSFLLLAEFTLFRLQRMRPWKSTFL